MIRFLVKVHNTEISHKICRLILALGSAALMEDKDPAHQSQRRWTKIELIIDLTSQCYDVRISSMYHDRQPSLRFIKRFDGLTLLDAADEHQLRIQQIASAKSLLDDG